MVSFLTHLKNHQSYTKNNFINVASNLVSKQKHHLVLCLTFKGVPKQYLWRVTEDI